MGLTRKQQIERFGMTTAQAHAVRDRAAASVADLSAARDAWRALKDEIREQCAPHPEAVRFKMLEALAGGASIEDATSAARAFAFAPT